MDNDTLGARIASLRKERGYKQDEVAEKLGVSPQAVSKWENDISAPDITALPILASMLGTTVDFLLTGKKDKTPETVYLNEDGRAKIDDLVLKITVDDDKDHIRVNLPVLLLKAFKFDPDMMGNMGINMGGVTIDWAQIMTLITNGVVGKLIEVDSEDGSHVEICVE